jgi:polar amino acid transport system permease protein
VSGIWHDFVTNKAELLSGLRTSVTLTLACLAIGLPAGLLLAVARTSGPNISRFLSRLVTEIGRGAPALLLLQLIYNGVPVTLTGFLAAALALALTTAAYTSEIMRGGLQAVPHGELEAGMALGMTDSQVMRDIVIPQGIRIAIPPLLGFCILIFQATSLAFVIAVPELMAAVKSIADANFRYFNMFVIGGVLYLTITVAFSAFTERVEKRLSRHV